MSLKDRTVVISGATGGLGAFLARHLAGEGANLALLGTDQQRLDSLGTSLGLPSERWLACEADLRLGAAAQSAVHAVQEKFGRLDILLHLVGGWVGGKSLVDSVPADLEAMLAQHVWSTFHLAQACVPGLVKNHWGRILIVSSPYATRPNARGGPYAAAKAAQEALVLSLSQELKDTGVTANILQVKSIDLKGEKLATPTPANASWSTLEEIGAAVMYLLSDQGGAVNGARLPLYGGF